MRLRTLPCFALLLTAPLLLGGCDILLSSMLEEEYHRHDHHDCNYNTAYLHDAHHHHADRPRCKAAPVRCPPCPKPKQKTEK